MILRNKILPAYSRSSIKSFQSESNHRCLLICKQNFLCEIAIYNLNGLCTLCKKQALNELINSIGQETTVFQIRRLVKY